jgi:hypothetical protein
LTPPHGSSDAVPEHLPDLEHFQKGRIILGISDDSQLFYRMHLLCKEMNTAFEGLITRNKKEQNKRVTYIGLTERGVQELEVLTARREAFQDKLLSDFTDEKIAALTGALQRMSTNEYLPM